MTTETAVHRERCLRCRRPSPLCYCARLPTVPTRTRIVVLQHPHERDHPFGTARLLRLCMPNAEVHVPWAGFTGSFEHPVDVGTGAVLLYPHPSAVDLAALRSTVTPRTIIAIDGTWGHVKRLYRENRWLHGLPHARLAAPPPSRYRIRREPQPDYVSTLEAIVAALRILEPDATGVDALLAAFDHMIDCQIAHSAAATRFGRRKAPRDRPARAVAPLLREPSLVVAYAETARPGGDPDLRREVVHFVAARVADGAVFEAVLRPSARAATDDHLRHMGLSRADLAGGESPASARQRFLDFAGARPSIAAWTPTTLAAIADLLPPGARTATLKPNYCNLRNRRAGVLDDVVRREGLVPVAEPCRGRAGSRLGNALAVASWLAEQSAPPRR